MKHPDIHAMRTEDYFAVLDHLRAEQSRALLAQTAIGPIMQPRIDALWDRIAPPSSAGRPFTDELQAADTLHDSRGEVLVRWLDLLDAIARLPGFGDAARLAADVRAAVRVDRALLVASYREEADTARRNRETRGGLSPAANAAPIYPGLTAGPLVDDFVEAGEQIGGLLARRAEVEAEQSRVREAEGNLRHQAQALVLDLRRALANEARYRDDLPADLDGQLFGVFDQQLAKAAARARRAGKGAGAAAVDGPAEG